MVSEPYFSWLMYLLVGLVFVGWFETKYASHHSSPVVRVLAWLLVIVCYPVFFCLELGRSMAGKP